MISLLSIRGWLILNRKSSSSSHSEQNCKNRSQYLPFQVPFLQPSRKLADRVNRAVIRTGRPWGCQGEHLEELSSGGEGGGSQI